MPLPLAAIAQGAGIAESIIQPVTQHLTNVKNRKFTREMYNRQRQDALSDWATQNAYNSPAAQMARFKDAGLNPHLIYGQGNTAQPVRSSSSSGGQATAPTTSLAPMYNYALKSNQANLVSQNQELLKAREENIKANTVKTLSEVDLTKQTVSRGAIKLAIETQLKDVSIAKALWEKDKAAEEYWQANIKTRFMEAYQQKGLDKATAEISRIIQETNLSKDRQAEINQRIENLKKTGQLQDYEIQLNKGGAQRNDSVTERLILKIMQLIFGENMFN